MADQIVSWGGFDSKGTSGMGITGSLIITGSSSSTLLEIDSPASNNILFVSGSGRVGIGTATDYGFEVSNTSSLQAPITNIIAGYATGSAAVKITPHIYATAGNRTYYSMYIGNPGITTSGSFGSYDFKSLVTAGGAVFNGGILAGDSRFYATSNAVSFQGYNPYNGQTGVTAGGITFTSRQVDGSNEAGIGAYYGAGSRLYIYNKYNASDSKIIFALAGTTIRAAFFGTGNLSIGNEETDMSARVGIKGSGTTSSTTALLVQNANASSSFSIKDNGDSTFSYPGVAGYSLKISGSYSGNGASAIYETSGATGGYYGIHEFRVGTNTSNALRAMSITYGGRVIIGNKSNTVLQFPGANLLIDTNVVNTFNNSTQAFNTGIIINPSGSLNTQQTASGILFNFAASDPNDTNGGAFIGSQYNPLTNGYDTDLVIYNSQAAGGSYVETARFVGKSKSLSLGAGRNPSASLHVSGSGIFTDSVTITGSLTVSGSNITSAWTSYTPTWTAVVTNPSIGDGTITGAYKLIGKTCFVRARVTMGSTTTYGSGAWFFSLPFSGSSAHGILLPATMLDNGNNWYSGLVNGGRLGSTSKSEIQWQNTSGVAVGLESTVPFTWGASDELEFNGSYEIA